MAKILLVDDSRVVLKAISQMLINGNYEIITANDGREAFEIFQSEEEKFDLVITDINMPNLNGMELTEKIRSGQKHKDIPVVVLSTEESDKIKEEGKRVGVSAWIVKPPREELLLKAVKHFLP